MKKMKKIVVCYLKRLPPNPGDSYMSVTPQHHYILTRGPVIVSIEEVSGDLPPWDFAYSRILKVLQSKKKLRGSYEPQRRDCLLIRRR